MVNSFSPDTIYHSFGESKYGFGKKLISNLVYFFFFSNDIFRGGGLYIVLAEKQQLGE
jgi:hypothetical protein